jgi:hypothetical protein
MNAKLSRALRTLKHSGPPPEVHHQRYLNTLMNYNAAANRKAASQRTKPVRERKRKAKAAIKPTWPRTPNQMSQSRPLIVERPMRALRNAMYEMTVPDKDGVRKLSHGQRQSLVDLLVRNPPKHYLDQIAAHYGK